MDTVFSFEGKVAIVAGGASGIGKAIAAGLLAAGAKVTIFDIDREGCGAAVRELGGDSRERITSTVCDIRDAGSVAKAVKEAIGKFGVPDFLVNSVAVTKRKSALELSDDEIDAIMSTNFSGVFARWPPR